MSRELNAIGADIKSNWSNVNYAAVPYLDALCHLKTIDDKFYQDDAKTIILYFLSNAKGWKGIKAKNIKTELKNILIGK